MKRILFSFIAITTIFSMSNGLVIAADDTITPVTLGVDSSIAISCTNSVTMSPIVSTGQSTVDSDNEATCTIETNDSDGYELEWTASSATMASGGDTIAAYTPAVADTPEEWSVGSSASEWGARLKSTSDDTAAEWGTADGYNTSSNWLNVSTSARQIVTRTSETGAGGSDEIIQFGAEIGSSKIQPTGNYTVNVTMTATTL